MTYKPLSDAEQDQMASTLKGALAMLQRPAETTGTGTGTGTGGTGTVGTAWIPSMYTSPIVGRAGQVPLSSRPDWATSSAPVVAPGGDVAGALAKVSDGGIVVLDAGTWTIGQFPLQPPNGKVLVFREGSTVSLNGASGLTVSRVFNGRWADGKPGGQGSVIYVPKGGLVDQIDLASSDAFGITVWGTVRHALAHNCARLGFAGWQTDGVLEDWEAYNCGFGNPWWTADGEAAGGKVVAAGQGKTKGLTANRGYVHDMSGPGWWYDSQNIACSVNGLFAERCDGPGLMVEISGPGFGTVQNVAVRDCGRRGTGTVGVQACQILVCSSAGVILDTFDVTAGPGVGGVVLLNDGRGPGINADIVQGGMQRLSSTSFTGWTGGTGVSFRGSKYPGLDPAAKVFMHGNGQDDRLNLADWIKLGQL